MTAHETRNVRRTLRLLSSRWGYPVWLVERTIQQSIDECWQTAQNDPGEKALWDKYFPNGKPTAQEYILLLGNAHENGQHVPRLLKDKL